MVLALKTPRRLHLVYVDDGRPGIGRKIQGKKALYFHANGRIIRSAGELKRLRGLAIPPAWKQVWISPQANAYLQATGRDQRGRKQYIYHPRWREFRDETKFHHLMTFADRLPRIRAAVKKDLAKPGLPREKVLATVVRLLEQSLIRVGNEEYARKNHSYGLTTLQDRHVKIRGQKIRFAFRGKSGVFHHIEVEDPALAKIVRRCRDLPGEELFQYLDLNGRVVDIKSGDVNDYLHQIAGEEFSAKDFRTWVATVLAAKSLSAVRALDTKKFAKKHLLESVEKVARQLGNTLTICRKSYIHPAIFDSYLDGSLSEHFLKQVRLRASRRKASLSADERCVLRLLQSRLRGTDRNRLERNLRASLTARA